MRILTYLGPRTLAATAFAGLFVGAFAWLILPPAPRVIMPQDDRFGRLAISKDARFIAAADGDREDMRSWKGELRVWDTQEQRLLFSVPYGETHPPATDGGYSIAFTPNADKLVTYNWGKTKFYDVPSGKPWQPDVAHQFPQDGREVTPSYLTSDQNGELFVLVNDQTQNKITILDLWTAKQIKTWDGGKYLPEPFAGGIIDLTDTEVCARKLPNGEPHARLKMPPINPAASPSRISYFVATPDCQTLVHIARTVRVATPEGEKEFDLAGSQFPALSPDGRLLALLVHRGHAYRDWLGATLRFIGLRRPDSSFVVYDLNNGAEIAQLSEARSAQFSLDGKTLIMVRDDTIDLYDVPLRSPWSKIACTGLAVAALVFVVGQWARWRRKKPARVPR